MLSDSLREARQRCLADAHCGRIVISSEELIAQAAVLAAWETEARNLEAEIAKGAAADRLVKLLAKGTVADRLAKLTAGRGGPR